MSDQERIAAIKLVLKSVAEQHKIAIVYAVLTNPQSLLGYSGTIFPSGTHANHLLARVALEAEAIVSANERLDTEEQRVAHRLMVEQTVESITKVTIA